jgi:YD repeat-containing protein
MSDGTVQLELSPQLVNYRDRKGKWQPIDTAVLAGKGETAYVAEKNSFGVRFGKNTKDLARFEDGARSISIAAQGAGRAAAPAASGSTVRYPDVFGSADVQYQVTTNGLKEDIVLDKAPAAGTAYSFELGLDGLSAREIKGGGIGFFVHENDKLPRYVIPAPVMQDSSAFHSRSLNWSSEVKQTMTRHGKDIVVTIDPDDAWLTDPARVYPVRIDPTITVVPGPTDAQDALISSNAPTTAYPSDPTIPVGRYTVGSTSQYFRGLYKFDTSMIPANTTIRAADLNLYYSVPFWSEANVVPISAVPLTKTWNEATATWSDLNTSYLNAYAQNTVIVDDADGFGATSFEGPWKRAADSRVVGGMLTWTPTAATTPDTFTWNARVPGPGNYRVSASYSPYTDRGTPTYQITGPAGPGQSSDSVTSASVNQAVAPAPSWAPWVQLVGNKYFEPGRTASVTMTRQGGTTATRPVADAIRLEEFSSQTKDKDQHDTWHSFAVGSLVQSWINGASNYGIQVMATNDSTAPVGGPVYHASEYALAAAETRPNLVITYDEPGVTLSAPSTINANGPELHWSGYVDPSAAPDDDLAEYQIYRGCRTLPGGACTNPVGDYFSTSSGNAQLVGTVPKDVTTFTDTTALASTASESATYNYWVVARTAADLDAGQNGRAASNVQAVTTPREGRVIQVFSGDISDTTLSSALPTTNVSRPTTSAGVGPNNNQYWIQAGNSHPTYGDEHAVFKFDTSGVKQGVKVTDGKVQLFEANGSTGSGATFDLHALTKDFVESEATWGKASSTIPWATGGGDIESTPVASVSGLVYSLPGWVTFADSGATKPLLGKVQSWVNDASTNHGFLLKAHDDSLSQQWLAFINGESKSGLEPRLVVEHLVKNSAQMYEANEIPQRWVPGTTITTPVTVTNTMDFTWPADLKLSYRWTAPDSTTEITGYGTISPQALGRALAPGESVKLNLPIRAPINSDTGSKRQAYDLYLDLWSDTNGWFSTTNPPAPPVPADLSQGCAVGDKGLLCPDRFVEDPRSNQIGLEKFLSYTGEETGGGSQLLANLFSGNTVWSYDAWSNPSIGPRSFLRLAYNSFDLTDAGAGFGISVQPGTLTRLGANAFSAPSGGSVPNDVTIIDGDGTTHVYKWDTSTTNTDTYVRPPGVQLDLIRDKNATDDKQWVFSRPDGTRFYYSQSKGLPTSIVDRNNNSVRFSYDSNDRLISVQDGPQGSGARVVLSLGYNNQGLDWIMDISHRALKFGYSSSHQLTTLQDGDKFDSASGQFGSGAEIKTFRLHYPGTPTNINDKLDQITDPMGHVTGLDYWKSTDLTDTRFTNWLRDYTDRRGNRTDFAYTDAGGTSTQQPKDVIATVTDANGTTPSVTTYQMDGYGRTTRITDANANTTRLGWDNDHNVIRLEEPNGAVSTWRYDAKTGYPLEVDDALSVKNGTPGITLTYDPVPKIGANGAPVTVLTRKTSAQGRYTAFGYDDRGNLAAVRNGLNNGPNYTYNADGTLDTAVDANAGSTHYSGYDANGYPTSITDPLGFVTAFSYDVRGNVMQVTDAENRVTTADYDGFGRPKHVTTPYDGSVTRTTANPV